MHRTRVKICGITRPDLGLAAAGLGADAIGLVFHPPSPRAVAPEAAAAIARVLPPFVAKVGLFVDAEPALVRGVLGRVALDLLQFHGAETPEYCAAFERPFLKAVPMAEAADVAAYGRRFGAAAGLLLDSHGAGKIGGSGRRFDWDAIPRGLESPLVLAGGLAPGNVAAAIRQVRPYAVDVSSGVESVKGVKDVALIQAFMAEVARGDSGA